MDSEEEFKTLFSASLKQGGSISMSFPTPKELSPYTLSYENIDRAIEYYLLARYAYIHNMSSSFMINSFWAVEHLMLSILIFDIEKKEDLSNFGGYHSITNYWKKAKELQTGTTSQIMNRFDDYIGKIKGYFSERYPTINERCGLQYTSKYPKVTFNNTNKTVKFGKVAHLNIDELDHFVNFMLHDITIYKKDCSTNLMSLLLQHDNTKLYQQDNLHSIIYPNKKYNGELNAYKPLKYDK